MDKYRDPTGKRVFRFYKMYANVHSFSACIHGIVKQGKKGVFYTGLKKVGAVLGIDDLEYYAARHSWASIASNDLDVDKYTVHLALNHVDSTTKITDTYLKTDWSPIDRANRKVLDYVLG
jgi:integrase